MPMWSARSDGSTNERFAPHRVTASRRSIRTPVHTGWHGSHATRTRFDSPGDKAYVRGKAVLKPETGWWGHVSQHHDGLPCGRHPRDIAAFGRGRVCKRPERSADEAGYPFCYCRGDHREETRGTTRL